MKKTVGNQTSLRLRHIAKHFASLTIIALFAYFALPAIAQTQKAFWETDTSKIEFLSPQTNSRPDILWMRGGHQSASNGLAYIENGQKLVSLADSIVKIFRTSDGMLLRSIAVPGATEGFAVSIDGQRVAVGTSISGVHGINIYSLSNSSLLLSIPTNFAPISISFSPADNQIIAGALMGGNWNTAAMFDSVNGNFIRFVMHNSLRVGGYVAFSPDGQTFAAHEELGGGGGALALFNSSTGAWIKTYANVEGIVSFSPDGMKLATANGGNVTVFSTFCAPGSCNSIFSGIAGNSNPAFSSNSQLLAINYGSGRIRVWNTSNTAIGWSQNNDYVITQNGYNITFGSRLAFAPDNQTLASAASQIILSNVSNGSLIRNLSAFAYSAVPSLAFSSDGQTLATVNYNSVSSDDSIKLWNVADGSRRNVSFPQSIGLNPAQIFIAPDNQTLLTLDNGNVKFWNATNGSLIRDVPQSSPGSPAGAISLSPDGQIYAVGKTLGQTTPVTDLYRTSDDSLIRRLNHGGGSGSAFSPNNQLFATGQVTQSGNFNKIKIFNVSNGTELQTLNLSAILSRNFPNVAFSPDSQTIAVIEEVGTTIGSRTGIVELFRVSDGVLLRTLGTFDGWGASVAFAPDGQTVIATGYDATVRVWRASDGALLQTYNEETGVADTNGGSAVLYQIAYSPDGSRFAYGRRDATVVMARNPYPTTPPTSYTISGNITRNSSALANVSVALSGSTAGTTMTDGGGNYSFTVNDGGSYTVTPTLTGNNFAPASQTFNFIAGNQTANFNASLVTHTIGGNITRNGSALNGVIINLSGSATDSTTTDASGNYSLTVNQGGNYTVTPALAGNIFTPTNRNFNNVTTAQTGNFTALFSTYTISGNVKADGANLQGASIILSGSQTQTTTTDASGNYTLTANTNGNYTVSAFKNGYAFNPASQTVTNLQTNQTVNFQLANNVMLCVPAPSGLTAWYKGENNASDSSGNGITGTLSNGTTFGVGKVDQAFSFDGIDDRVSIPDSPSNSPSSAITVDAWIKPFRVNQQQVFISKYNNLTSQDAFTLNSDVTGGKVEFRIYQTGDSGGSYKIIQTTNNVLSVNVFTHIAGTFDTAMQSMKIYVNGVDMPTTVIESVGSLTSIFDSIEPVRLGDLVNSAGNHVLFFQGLIDEPQIYNRALSQTEIQNIYNSGSAGNCANATNTPTSANGKIAFSSNRTGNYEIFTMNPDGSNQTNVSNNAADDIEPAWSPDGSKIAFSDANDIYTINSDGSNRTRLITGGNNRQPSWSFDGTKITFSSNRDGNDEIYVMSSNGMNLNRLTNNSVGDYSPKFSPNGLKIVFDRSHQIWTMNADGSNQIRLINTPGAGEEVPVFSPDGLKIAFLSNRNGNSEIFTMNADGTNQTNVSNNIGFDDDPAWSPDGTKITFYTNRDNNNEIYTMNADGSNQSRLTNNSVIDYSPSWQRSSANTNVAPLSNLNLTFSNVTQAGNTVATTLTASQLPALPNGYNLFASAPMYDIRTSATYSGNITVTLNVPNVASSMVCSELRLLHFETNVWTSNINGIPIYNGGTQTCTISQTVTSLSPFAVVQFAPLAANVSIGGRILAANGNGIRNVIVTLTDSDGNTRTVRTGAFGYYRFDEVEVGGTYIISVRAKRFTFAQSSQVLNVSDDLANVDFVAQE